mmetsp:Transcript_154330/g.268846  ORF Transcript_154330/g.268846 Transcript_154330/m.268846 type:complete len:92 (-) Transcript_154330:95-370(-)
MQGMVIRTTALRSWRSSFTRHSSELQVPGEVALRLALAPAPGVLALVVDHGRTKKIKVPSILVEVSDMVRRGSNLQIVLMPDELKFDDFIV